MILHPHAARMGCAARWHRPSNVEAPRNAKEVLTGPLFDERLRMVIVRTGRPDSRWCLAFLLPHPSETSTWLGARAAAPFPEKSGVRRQAETDSEGIR